MGKQDEDMHKEINDRADGIERHHANVAKETSKRLNALDLRISGLQGASGEQKRDINKLRDEVNNLTVKSAAHGVDIGKNSDDIKKMERQRSEDNQRHKQDMDAVYEELDQKVYEKNFLGLEDNVCKLTRGSVKLCQVVGVFPGARMGWHRGGVGHRCGTSQLGRLRTKHGCTGREDLAPAFIPEVQEHPRSRFQKGRSLRAEIVADLAAAHREPA